jgi:hypothetical protein
MQPAYITTLYTPEYLITDRSEDGNPAGDILLCHSCSFQQCEEKN